MEYEEFLEKIAEPHGDSENLQFDLIWYLWPHSTYFPVKVTSLSADNDPVVKIPDQHKKENGKIVPVRAFVKNLFVGKEHITDIILPRSLDSIPQGAFAGCKNLQRLTIPIGVTAILEGTFVGCDSLQDVFYEGTEEEWRDVKIVHDGRRIVNEHKLGLYCEVESFDIPGNEPLLNANIHFNCSPGEYHDKKFVITAKGRDITDMMTMKEEK